MPDAPQPGMSVPIADGRIAALGRTSEMASPADVELDATGKYLVPGLWNMHVHVRYAGEKKALSAHLATGVTGLRDMGSPGR